MRYLTWKLPDPAGKGIDAVRPIRDEIDRRVRDLVQQLYPSRSERRPGESGYAAPDIFAA